ncbi:hypothetical protein ACIGO6_15055 [Streptomyces sp. NPDC053750]|uniref:SGM_3592 family protein n=1 Tax=Streptomyces sp. NPDC053750 TaxID=3365714 RepID=UPI0037CFA915
MAGQTPQQNAHEQPEDDGGNGGNGRGGGPEDAAGDDTWDRLVLDEDFVRAADTSEPSARARMLTARWRREKPEPQPWRSDEPPAGWFFSKGRRRRWRRR